MKKKKKETCKSMLCKVKIYCVRSKKMFKALLLNYRFRVLYI